MGGAEPSTDPPANDPVAGRAPPPTCSKRWPPPVRTARCACVEHLRGVMDVIVVAGLDSPALVARAGRGGDRRPWSHQVEAADAVRRGEDVVLATGTASGKSLGYLLPPCSRRCSTAPRHRPGGARPPSISRRPRPWRRTSGPGSRRSFCLACGWPPMTGTPPDERRWIREHAGYVLTNPDLVHFPPARPRPVVALPPRPAGGRRRRVPRLPGSSARTSPSSCVASCGWLRGMAPARCRPRLRHRGGSPAGMRPR